MDFSRQALVFFAAINPLLSICYRGFLRFVLRRYRKKGYNLKHCLVVGTSSIAVELLNKLNTHPYWGYHVVGCIRTDSRKSDAFGGYRILGNIDDLEQVLTDYYFDSVMIATDEQNANELGSILKSCEKAGVKAHIIPYYHKYVPFYMYKFRSMRVQTDEEEKDKWTTKNDPRKTWWGNIMRKTSIDELPQFYNVLKGDMSVVGPRPERPFFVDKFKEEIPRYMVKHQVRPGITGWAQVNGLRGDTSIEDRIEHDLYYSGYSNSIACKGIGSHNTTPSVALVMK